MIQETDILPEDLNKNVLALLHRSFCPEFLNRVGDTIIFHRLSINDIKSIVDIQLHFLSKHLFEKNHFNFATQSI